MGKFTEYKLPLKSMVEGTHTFEYHLGKQFFTDMESADIHDADLTVHLTAEHKRELYHLEFNIEGNITILCDRCLDFMTHPIDATYAIDVKYGDCFNDESDSLLVIPESNNHLNVAYMIHDTVALAIPIKHVHPAGQCNRQMSAMLRKHRAQSFDSDDEEFDESLIDENIRPETDTTDPRWDALKNLDLE